MTYGGATLRERLTRSRNRPGGILSTPFPQFGQVVGTVGMVQKTRIWRRVGALVGGVGGRRSWEKLAEILSPELIAMRFWECSVMFHKGSPVPGNGPCKEGIIGHGDRAGDRHDAGSRTPSSDPVSTNKVEIDR